MSDDRELNTVECECGRTVHIEPDELPRTMSWPKEYFKLFLLVCGAIAGLVNSVTDHLVGILSIKDQQQPDPTPQSGSGLGMLNEDK